MNDDDRKLCEATAERLGWELEPGTDLTGPEACFLIPVTDPNETAGWNPAWITLNPANPLADMEAAARVPEAAVAHEDCWNIIRMEDGKGFLVATELEDHAEAVVDPNPLRAAMRLVTKT